MFVVWKNPMKLEKKIDCSLNLVSYSNEYSVVLFYWRLVLLYKPLFKGLGLVSDSEALLSGLVLVSD